MTTGLIILELLLFLLVFLITLNEYLLGASKDKIRTFLFVLHLILVLAVFIIYGWLIGAVTVGLVLVLAFVSNPLARFASFKILGFRTSFRDSTPTDYRLNNLMSGEASLDEYLEEEEKQARKDEERFAKIVSAPRIRDILDEYGATEGDLEKWKVLLGDIYWDVLSNPQKLRILLGMKKQGLSDIEVMFKISRV